MATYPFAISRQQLWRGAVLSTIAHAIWIAQDPILAYEQSWDGRNYNIQDSQGALGTITFAELGVIGAFFDAHSPRSPFRSNKTYTTAPFFEGMPTALWEIAQAETLQYLLQEYQGSDVPLITAAFWSEGENLASTEPWSEVFDNGAHLVRIQLLEPEDAIADLQSNYELSPQQVNLLRSLFIRKTAAPDIPIILNDQERSITVTQGATGVEESRELLAAIGIVLPE